MEYWPAFIDNDGSVWLGVDGDQVDLRVGGRLVNVTWRNGDRDLVPGGLADESTEWELSHEVLLESSLEFLVQEWDLDGQFVVRLPCVNWVCRN